VRLLVTRPEPDGERTAQALRARGHAVVLAPLLRTEPVAFALPDERFSAVVFTSANAVRAVADHPRRAQLTAMPAFTVGRRTAEAARAVGFRALHSADGDKGDLVALLRADLVRTQSDTHGAPLLYLAGEDRAGDLAQGDLAQGGLPVRTVVVYRAVKAAHFPPEVAAALARGAIDGVLHFSARSAEAYLDCAASGGIRDQAIAPMHYCLSRQVAEPLAAAGAAAVRIAVRPDEASLLELMGSLGTETFVPPHPEEGA
jgi:uroporphyrinogen-III synthase